MHPLHLLVISSGENWKREEFIYISHLINTLLWPITALERAFPLLRTRCLLKNPECMPAIITPIPKLPQFYHNIIQPTPLLLPPSTNTAL